MQPLCTEQLGCDRNLLCLLQVLAPQHQPHNVLGCWLGTRKWVSAWVTNTTPREASLIEQLLCSSKLQTSHIKFSWSGLRLITDSVVSGTLCKSFFSNNSRGYKERTSRDQEVGVSCLEGTSAFRRYPAPRPFSCCPVWPLLLPRPYLPYLNVFFVDFPGRRVLVPEVTPFPLSI